jgi:hypothetical protein
MKIRQSDFSSGNPPRKTPSPSIPPQTYPQGCPELLPGQGLGREADQGRGQGSLKEGPGRGVDAGSPVTGGNPRPSPYVGRCGPATSRRQEDRVDRGNDCASHAGWGGTVGHGTGHPPTGRARMVAHPRHLARRRRLPWLERTLSPIIVASQLVPKVALIPLFVVWFGYRPEPKPLVVTVMAFFPRRILKPSRSVATERPWHHIGRLRPPVWRRTPLLSSLFHRRPCRSHEIETHRPTCQPDAVSGSDAQSQNGRLRPCLCPGQYGAFL